jgi:hypothetical protein
MASSSMYDRKDMPSLGYSSDGKIIAVPDPRLPTTPDVRLGDSTMIKSHDYIEKNPTAPGKLYKSQNSTITFHLSDPNRNLFLDTANSFFSLRVKPCLTGAGADYTLVADSYFRGTHCLFKKITIKHSVTGAIIDEIPASDVLTQLSLSSCDADFFDKNECRFGINVRDFDEKLLGIPSYINAADVKAEEIKVGGVWVDVSDL